MGLTSHYSPTTKQSQPYPAPPQQRDAKQSLHSRCPPTTLTKRLGLQMTANLRLANRNRQAVCKVHQVTARLIHTVKANAGKIDSHRETLFGYTPNLSTPPWLGNSDGIRGAYIAIMSPRTMLFSEMPERSYFRFEPARASHEVNSMSAGLSVHAGCHKPSVLPKNRNP